ncbi:hypothetical protein EJV44_14985 [Ancylobacter aquaticus]|nr:hypothetical protein EJV44_14985 [Ancylobacter aquaticus]
MVRSSGAERAARGADPLPASLRGSHAGAMPAPVPACGAGGFAGAGSSLRRRRLRRRRRGVRGPI